MITITGKAKEKILELLTQESQEGLALRVAIKGRGPGGFLNELAFVGGDEKSEDDLVMDGGGFNVYIDGATQPNISGATLDWVEGAYGSGFKIDNPNPIWKDPVALAVQQVIDEKVNPGVAGHGGNVTLLDVRGDTAYLKLGGGCQGCGMADVTLRQGIEVMIKEAVPTIRNIVDTTDHAGGTNPYYQGGGHSHGGGHSSCG
jgi:Fe/S biogenesis protein NfuA